MNLHRSLLSLAALVVSMFAFAERSLAAPARCEDPPWHLLCHQVEREVIPLRLEREEKGFAPVKVIPVKKPQVVVRIAYRHPQPAHC